MSVTASPEFDEALAAIQGIEGWLSVAQARLLFDHAATLPAGATIVEIGSYRGRSTIVLARGAAEGVELVAIDPHAGNDRGPRQIRGSADEGQREHEAFVSNLQRAGVLELVRHVRRPSQQALDAVSAPIELLYIDGAHRYRPARDDIGRWGERVAPGGTLLLHDSFSAVGVTLAQARLLLFTGRFRFVRRMGTLSEYRREDLGVAGRAVNVLKQLAQLPSFARNVLVKLALLARMRRLAWVLGQRTGEWPY
jgi:predicted O-methyltransferase YrrM